MPLGGSWDGNGAADNNDDEKDPTNFVVAHSLDNEPWCDRTNDTFCRSDEALIFPLSCWISKWHHEAELSRISHYRTDASDNSRARADRDEGPLIRESSREQYGCQSDQAHHGPYGEVPGGCVDGICMASDGNLKPNTGCCGDSDHDRSQPNRTAQSFDEVGGDKKRQDFCHDTRDTDHTKKKEET